MSNTKDIPYYTDVNLDIGICSLTKYGNVIKIIGKVDNKLTYTCDRCSEDRELYPDQKFSSLKGNLKAGKICCGCSAKPSWNEDQFKILAHRSCNASGFIFLGWANNFKGSKTAVSIYDPENDCEWSTTILATLLSKRGTKESPAGKLKRMEIQFRKPDEDIVNSFYVAGFSNDYTFKRNKTKVNYKGYKDYWDYTCPRCSNDEYVKQGLCDGIFTSDSYRLSRYVKSCRCNDKYPWTKEQREYQLETLCSSEGSDFISFIDTSGWKIHSKFQWICKKGHLATSPVTGYLHEGKRCSKCVTTGFKANMPANLYIVRWGGEDYSCIKFGISNNDVRTRTSNQKSKTCLVPEVLYIFNHESGELIRQCESTIKKLLQTGTCDRKVMPRGFSETIEDTEENLNKVLYIISTFNLNKGELDVD